MGTGPLPGEVLTASAPQVVAGAEGPDLTTVDLTDHDVFAAAVPHAYFAHLRRHDPVHWTPQSSTQQPSTPGYASRGFWSVTRYEDIVEVSRDVETYSSQVGASALEDLEPDALEARRSMIDVDPPEHTVLRRAVTHPFTRRAVSGYTDRVRAVVTEVLDGALAPEGEFDAVEEIAVKIPIRVLCQILGVPREDEHLLVTLGDRMIANTDPDLTDVLFDGADSDDHRLLPFRNPASLEMHAYGRSIARLRAADPRDDLVSHLVNGARGRDRLVGRDFDAMFLLLVVAGNETTRSALSLGVQAFLDHPQEWERLRRLGPQALPAATEEVLRFTTPLHHFRRTATRDATLAGRPIAAGDKVVVWYPSANRDGTVFADPDRFDVARDPNPHVSFGRGGPHRCVGEHLARLEIRITLEELLLRVRHLEQAGPASRVRSTFVNGLKALPVRAVPR